MRRVLIVVLMIAFVSCASTSSYGSSAITWATLSGGQLLYQDAGFTTLITGSDDPAIGAFVQLLFVGADGYDGLGAQGTTGVVDDDEVIAFSCMGTGVKNDNGAFSVLASPHAKPDGSQFAIRFFTAPSADYGNGYIPVSGNYGLADNGGGYFLSTSDIGDYFDITGNDWADTPVVIPEPGTLLLGLLGMGVLAARRKRAK